MAESQENSRMDSGQQEKSLDRNQRYVYSFLRNIIPDEEERIRLEKYCFHADMPFQAMIEIGLAVRDGLPDEDIELLCADVDKSAMSGEWTFLQKKRIASTYWNINVEQILSELIEVKHMISGHDQAVTIQGIQEFLKTSDLALHGVDRKILQIMQQIQELQENEKQTREETFRQMSQMITILQENWNRAPSAEYDNQDNEQTDLNIGGMVFVDEEELDTGESSEGGTDISDESAVEEIVRLQEDTAANCTNVNGENLIDSRDDRKLTMIIRRIKAFLSVRKERRKKIKRAKKNALSKAEKENLIRLLCENSYASDQMTILQEMIEDINFNGSDMEQIIRSGTGMTAEQLRQKIDMLRQIRQKGVK